MTGVLASIRTRHRRLLRLIALLVLGAQAVGIVVAPLAEARSSSSAPAHVEEGGTHLHWSHNPADCAACIALQLTPVPAHRAMPVPRRFVKQTPPVIPVLSAAHPERAGPHSPRAPPTLPAAIA
ncbi:MAG TPA: hypothetical protein VF041_21235 [Gemmatimonadaceae bacterium]